jgi:methylated-DNA-[protein]-cysteine S-methyltransferase
MHFAYVETPVGKLLLASDEVGLRHIAFAEGDETPRQGWLPDSSKFEEAVRQIHDYFAGRLKVFGLPLAPQGTPFQQKVWEVVRAIPYGRTVTYADLARKLGKPTAARAVGAANACNPLPIVIPCHRVVGSNGELTGYIGGLEIKRKLLRLEQMGKLDEGGESHRATA